jgi:hypothetical protein
LPEDPVKAAKATAEWQEHLREEEEERRQLYDREHEKEHSIVLYLLEKAQSRLDAAKSKSALASAKAAVSASLPSLKQKIDAIDPKRKSSNLLTDYDAIIAALAGPYPDARLAALTGDPKPASELKADIERRLAQARAWLHKDHQDEQEQEHRGAPE